MKKIVLIMSAIWMSFMMACGDENQGQTNADEEMEIGEDPSGFGTGPSPGVDVPIETNDSTNEAQPDTVKH